MIAVLAAAAGLLAGAVGGGCVSLLVARLYGLQCPDPTRHELGAAEREALARAFTDHVAAVRQQVGAYADHLAGGDAVLRARLRTFEAGESS